MHTQTHTQCLSCAHRILLNALNINVEKHVVYSYVGEAEKRDLLGSPAAGGGGGRMRPATTSRQPLTNCNLHAPVAKKPCVYNNNQNCICALRINIYNKHMRVGKC